MFKLKRFIFWLPLILVIISGTLFLTSCNNNSTKTVTTPTKQASVKIDSSKQKNETNKKDSSVAAHSLTKTTKTVVSSSKTNNQKITTTARVPKPVVTKPISKPNPKPVVIKPTSKPVTKSVPKPVSNSFITLTVNSLSGHIISTETEPITNDESVFDVLNKATTSKKIPIDYSGFGPMLYVKGINNLEAGQYGATSGWTYKVNGVLGTVSAGSMAVKPGDRIEWDYVK